MPINNSFQFQVPSMQQPLANVFNSPIVGLRAPTTADLNYPIGQVWVQPKTSAGVAVNGYWALTSVVNNAANWTDLVGGAGVFSTLTVTPGPTALTGALTVTSGVNAVNISADAAANTINIGTGAAVKAVTIGSTTGASNTLIQGGAAGVTIAAPYLAIAGGNTYIYSGAGVPAGALAVHVGDLYINTTAATPTTRLYIANIIGTWTSFTALA